MLDTLFEGATVVDGSGAAPWRETSPTATQKSERATVRHTPMSWNRGKKRGPCLGQH